MQAEISFGQSGCESNDPSLAVIVWVAVPVWVQITSVPTDTANSVGAYALSITSTVRPVRDGLDVGDVVGVVVPSTVGVGELLAPGSSPPQADTSIPTAISTAANRARFMEDPPMRLRP
ncbi:MAG: hypothetical protein ACRDJ1_10975 [Actinomycetota bacterium]